MNDTDPDAPRWSLLDYSLDWPSVYDPSADSGEEWLVEPFLAAGRGHALYAPAKAGKSLLALNVAAAVATGRPIFHRAACEPLDVIYVDYEMTAGDVVERLEAFGYTDPTALARLHYVQLPDVAGLDAIEGGEGVAAAVEAVGARLVIIDTTGRAVGGPENEADTYRDFYQHTGRRLKRLRCTWLRLDHAGKDAERGQRGSSAKNDDVDVVWRMSADVDGFDLRATHRRMAWIPNDFHVVKRDDGDELTFLAARGEWPTGTASLAAVFDGLGLPTDVTARAARAALREAGETARNETLAAALRYRRNVPNEPPEPIFELELDTQQSQEIPGVPGLAGVTLGTPDQTPGERHPAPSEPEIF